MHLIAIVALASAQLSGDAAALYEKAKAGKFYESAAALKPEIVPMKSGKAFFAVWKSTENPEKYIVSVTGHDGFATDDLAIWHRHLKDRKVGLICVQWWLGKGEGRFDYLTPSQIYREVSGLLEERKVEAGSVMFHGFSRGSANSYSIAALDHGKDGKKWFSLFVASSGAYAPDYPPNIAIGNGDYGSDPLKGTKWFTCAGARDQVRDGIEAMRKSGEWLKSQGATVEAIEDPNYGHGALVLNPANAKLVLDRFLGKS